MSEIHNINLYYLIHGEGEITGTKAVEPSLKGKNICMPIETREELTWYLQNSPFANNMIMGLVSQFLVDNRSIITEEILLN